MAAPAPAVQILTVSLGADKFLFFVNIRIMTAKTILHKVCIIVDISIGRNTSDFGHLKPFLALIGLLRPYFRTVAIT